jgi:hypothetical protein
MNNSELFDQANEWDDLWLEHRDMDIIAQVLNINWQEVEEYLIWSDGLLGLQTPCVDAPMGWG